MIGAASGFAIVTVAITVAGTLGGIQPGSAFGLGVFVGIWGGGGFGFMMGAILFLARHTDAARAHRSSPPSPTIRYERQTGP